MNGFPTTNWKIFIPLEMFKSNSRFQKGTEMKRGLLLHILIVLMFGLSLNVSMPCFAQQNTIILAAKADAEFDAEEDINTTLWLATGGILGVVGNLPLGLVAMGGAYLYQPIPPVERLLGKPVDYVSIYTDAYKARARRLQLEAAGKGALGGSATFCLLGMVLNIKPWADWVFW